VTSADQASPYTFTVRRKNPESYGTAYALQTYRDDTFTLPGQAVALPLVCEECAPPTTFIISRLHDYISSRLVEQALLHRTDYAHLPLGMKEARHSYWRCKAALFPLCREGDCRAADPLTMAGGE
jgi:hypothetical protein